jgi:hypothetical protein
MTAFERLLTLVEEKPLSISLLAALQIAKSIADEELTSWIKLELMGYFSDNPTMNEDTMVPEYREVYGVWYNDYGQELVVNPDFEFINGVRLRFGVPELEGLAAGTQPQAVRLLSLAEIIRNSLKVEVSVFRFQPSSVNQVLTNIKVHLLDRLASRRERISATPNIPVAQEAEIFQIKPSIYGVSIDLKALWRRAFGTKTRQMGSGT